jgi:hypothetical protein
LLAATRQIVALTIDCFFSEHSFLLKISALASGLEGGRAWARQTTPCFSDTLSPALSPQSRALSALKAKFYLPLRSA